MRRANLPEAVTRDRLEWLSISTAAACVAFSLKPTSLPIPRLDVGMLNIVVDHVLYAVQIIANLSNLTRAMRQIYHTSCRCMIDYQEVKEATAYPSSILCGPSNPEGVELQ